MAGAGAAAAGLTMEMLYRRDGLWKQLEKTHEALSTALGVDRSVHFTAMKLWRSLYDLNPDLETDASQWFGCMILSSALNDRPNNLCRLQVNLTALLRKTNMSMLRLMCRMKHLREIVTLSDRTVQAFLAIQRKFCVSAALYSKFDTIYSEVFHSDDLPGTAPVENSHTLIDYVSETKQKCWFMFLLAKDELQSGSVELFVGFQILLCCLEYVLKSTPRFLVKSPFDGAMEQERETVDAIGYLTPLLKLMCQKYGCDSSDIVVVKKRLESQFLSQLLARDSAKSVMHSALCPAPLTCLSAHQLTVKYNAILDRLFELDESLFLTDDFIVDVTPQHKMKPKVPLRYSMADYEKVLLSSSLERPSKLEELLSSLSAIESLDSVLEECQPVLLAEMVGRDQEGAAGKEQGKPHFDLTVRLLNRILLCFIGEVQINRFSAMNLKDTLSNRDFLRSLLGCCLMVVLNLFTTSPIPTNTEDMVDDENMAWVLAAVGLSPFAFYPVIELVLNHEPALPWDLYLRLIFLHNRIIEYHVWRPESEVFQLLAKSEIRSANAALTGKNPDDVPDSQSSSQESNIGISIPFGNATSPERPSVSPRVVSSFINDVCRLAYRRLLQLCKLLDIRSDLEHRIWGCLEHCLVETYELLRGRHLDQIMMCAVYAICKVSEREHKFKTITQAYRRIPLTAAEVFKRTLVTDDSFDTIIIFYNRVFMQTLKSFILQFSSSKPKAGSDEPPPPPPRDYQRDPLLQSARPAQSVPLVSSHHPSISRQYKTTRFGEDESESSEDEEEARVNRELYIKKLMTRKAAASVSAVPASSPNRQQVSPVSDTRPVTVVPTKRARIQQNRSSEDEA